MNKYDYLIVGSGIYGSVMAHELHKQNKKVLVIDSRPTIGGNMYTEEREGIHVHIWGGHVFHTNNERVWNWVTQFTKFNDFKCKVKVNYQGKIYSFPINLFTLNQVYGVQSPEEAVNKLIEVRKPIENPANLEEWCLSQTGPELYEMFIKGYTEKQWNKPANQLPASIIKRLPIRMDMDDSYFLQNKYQGIPIGGYTQMFDKILSGVEVQLNTNFLDDRKTLSRISNKIIYTGAIDEYYEYCFGPLEYRSLKFEHITLPGTFQGTHTVNYTERNIPYTRIHENKYFDMNPDLPNTVITKEYPDNWEIGKERYYPITTNTNLDLYKKYKNINKNNVHFGGRLGTYQYMDMDQTLNQALSHLNDI